MSYKQKLLLSALTLAVLQACSSLPADNVALNSANQNFINAQNSPKVQQLAPVELAKAQTALIQAQAAWNNQGQEAEINHLAYLTKQSVAIAVETTKRKSAELEVANAADERNRVLLAIRSDEINKAQRDTQIAKGQTQNALAESAVANQRTREVENYAAQLQSRLAALNAKQTERGYVITMGDILFDNNQSELKPGASNNVEQLGTFMLQYPQRNVLVEGYTDNIGSTGYNQDLSTRRADSVRLALMRMGVGSNRIATQGYGETYPVGSNGSADGRQANRRVEIILSDDNGRVLNR